MTDTTKPSHYPAALVDELADAANIFRFLAEFWMAMEQNGAFEGKPALGKHDPIFGFMHGGGSVTICLDDLFKVKAALDKMAGLDKANGV